jgi:hypothetical protein
VSEPAYRRESLGRMAVFLLPSLKLKQRGPDGLAVEDRVHRFLLGNFAGYTVETGNILGFWTDRQGREHYGEHRLFRVAFAGEGRVPVLEAFLARVAAEIGEQSIYLETGEDAWLISPDDGGASDRG